MSKLNKTLSKYVKEQLFWNKMQGISHSEFCWEFVWKKTEVSKKGKAVEEDLTEKTARDFHVEHCCKTLGWMEVEFDDRVLDFFRISNCLNRKVAPEELNAYWWNR